MSLFLTSAYRPIIKRLKPTVTTIKKWPEGASLQLQDCFHRTDWSLFASPDLEEYTSTVLFYIRNCIETVTIDKRIRAYPNRKLWMTTEVQLLLRERDAAYRAGDSEQYSVARHNLKKGIKAAKATYEEKPASHCRPLVYPAAT